ncbi:hypothetical protein JD499_20190, partial [Aeromonas enteropelogenes]|uniref:hypothetical protein n=1 Tax=Aeromonas enteropelogenes TaxID=29489 RepID=UPI00191E8C19
AELTAATFVALVTSSDIENQKLFLMLDAVSAHTDCLIQIVKEQRSFWLLREWHSTQPPSRVKPYFQRFFEATDSVVCVAACRIDGGAL